MASGQSIGAGNLQHCVLQSVRCTSCMPYFKKLKIMTLPCLYIYETLSYTKMFLSTFKTNSMFHSYDTRNKSDLFTSRHNTKLFKQHPAYNAMLTYNKLSSEIQENTD
jgi:hypothetical protein